MFQGSPCSQQISHRRNSLVLILLHSFPVCALTYNTARAPAISVKIDLNLITNLGLEFSIALVEKGGDSSSTDPHSWNKNLQVHNPLRPRSFILFNPGPVFRNYYNFVNPGAPGCTTQVYFSLIFSLGYLASLTAKPVITAITR